MESAQNPVEAPEPKGDDDDEEEEEEHGEEEEEDDAAEEADNVNPLNNENTESKDDFVFDTHPNFPEQLAEYQYVQGQFKKNKLAYNEKMLKEAIIYDNTLSEEQEKAVTQGARYPEISKMLIHDPFHVPKKAGKKKKKKKKW